MNGEDALDALRAQTRPFEDAETALVRAIVSSPAFLSDADEAALRYALNLARTTRVRAPDGTDVDLGDFLAPYRDELLVPAATLAAPRGFAPADAARLVPHVVTHARAWRARVLAQLAGRLPASALDREVCEKALVLVCGGGGGVGWSYLGAFALLEQYGLVPRLLAGTSMGAVLLLFRARRLRWHSDDVADAMRGLSFRTLFRFLHGESRYGLPAAMRLYLRAGIGEFLKGPDGHPLTLGQLAIPLVVAVTGIRNGALPRDPSYYEHLLDLGGAEPRAERPVAHRLRRVPGDRGAHRPARSVRARSTSAPTRRRARSTPSTRWASRPRCPGSSTTTWCGTTSGCTASCATLLERHDLFRLVDGGLVDNLPARAAWGAVQRGALGTRNAFVLALEGFGPKLTQPLWFGLEQLAAQNVARNRPFIHLHKSFQRVLSPLEVVPDDAALQRAIQAGKAELHPEMPFVARMCRPFPALA